MELVGELMTVPLKDFIVSLSANLASELIKRGASRLHAAAFGDAEQGAILRAFKEAFEQMLTETLSHLEGDDQIHITDLLDRFVSSEEIRPMWRFTDAFVETWKGPENIAGRGVDNIQDLVPVSNLD